MENKEPESTSASSSQQEFSLKTLIVIVAMIAASIAVGLYLG